MSTKQTEQDEQTIDREKLLQELQQLSGFTGFERQGAVNAKMLRLTLQCDCKPYVDILTGNRWNAQGMKMKRNEKGHRITIVSHQESEDLESEQESKPKFYNAVVFCRCQVEPMSDKMLQFVVNKKRAAVEKNAKKNR